MGPPLEAVVLATNPQMVTALLIGEHLEPTAVRLELLDLVLPPWNSEEDSVEARQNKFIMSILKKRLIKTPKKTCKKRKKKKKKNPKKTRKKKKKKKKKKKS